MGCHYRGAADSQQELLAELSVVTTSHTRSGRAVSALRVQCQKNEQFCGLHSTGDMQAWKGEPHIPWLLASQYHVKQAMQLRLS